MWTSPVYNLFAYVINNYTYDCFIIMVLQLDMLYEFANKPSSILILISILSTCLFFKTDKTAKTPNHK